MPLHAARLHAARLHVTRLHVTRRRAIATGLSFFALVTAGLTIAEAQSSPRVRRACLGDSQRLCPREKKDSAEMRYCMEAKGRQLSRGCVRALEDDGIVPRGYFKS